MPLKPFDLVMGTERAQALQNSIQDELTKRGYSPDADPVMAEYITIMLINNKTAEQITTELQDLIGANEFDPSFTEWLFTEAAKKPASSPAPAQVDLVPEESSLNRRGPGGGPRTTATATPSAAGAGLYQAALAQAIPSSSSTHHPSPQSAHASTGQKRAASARTPSPTGSGAGFGAGGSGSNKSRRTDAMALPTGPRAMQHQIPITAVNASGLAPGVGATNVGSGSGSGKSLLERVGGRRFGGNGNAGGYARDEVQARIDAVTNHHQNTMGMNGFGGAPGMGMNPGMMGGVGGPGLPGAGPNPNDMAGMSPLALQEIMMNQMALLAQMANSMGMLQPAQASPGYPPAGFPMDAQGQPVFPQQQNGAARRGGATTGRGRGRGGVPASGGGSAQWVAPHVAEAQLSQPTTSSTPVPTLNPQAAVVISSPTMTPPSRPQSPTLCKFGLKCTNPMCRFSHPSPVSTPESGMVLKTDACEQGKDCKDKDCVKTHVSPAVLTLVASGGGATIKTELSTPSVATTTLTPGSAQGKIPCRYGASCTRIHSGCIFAHPTTNMSETGHGHGSNPHFNQQCRFGSGCTRGTCPFQHPPGRVLPSSFHRGLSAGSPIVYVGTPEAGSMTGAAGSPHRSMVFNRPAQKDSAAKEAEKKGDDKGKVVPKESTVVEAAA